MPEPLEISAGERGVLAALILLLGASGGLGLGTWLKARRPPKAADGSLGARIRSPRGDDPSAPPRLLALLSEAGKRPAAARFAEEFQGQPELKAAWEAYLKGGDLHALVLALKRARGFQALIERYGRDPEFRSAAEGLLLDPQLSEELESVEAELGRSGRAGETGAK